VIHAGSVESRPVHRAVGRDEQAQPGAGVVGQHRARAAAGGGRGTPGAAGVPDDARCEVVCELVVGRCGQRPVAGSPRELAARLVVIGAVVLHKVIQPDGVPALHHAA
jgi:hypothetical protein